MTRARGEDRSRAGAGRSRDARCSRRADVTGPACRPVTPVTRGPVRTDVAVRAGRSGRSDVPPSGLSAGRTRRAVRAGDTGQTGRTLETR